MACKSRSRSGYDDFQFGEANRIHVERLFISHVVRRPRLQITICPEQGDPKLVVAESNRRTGQVDFIARTVGRVAHLKNKVALQSIRDVSAIVEFDSSVEPLH